jgi:hypothetical protein
VTEVQPPGEEVTASFIEAAGEDPFGRLDDVR